MTKLTPEHVRELLSGAEDETFGRLAQAKAFNDLRNAAPDLARHYLAACETVEARPLDEWCEEIGPVVWWTLPCVEASWIGKPDDSDWPGYHTHFTPHPQIPSNSATLAKWEAGK